MPDTPTYEQLTAEVERLRAIEEAHSELRDALDLDLADALTLIPCENPDTCGLIWIESLQCAQKCDRCQMKQRLFAAQEASK